MAENYFSENQFYLVTRDQWVSSKERSEFYRGSYPVAGDVVEKIKQHIYEIEHGILERTEHQGNWCVVNIPHFYRYCSQSGNVHEVIYPGLEELIAELKDLNDELWSTKPSKEMLPKERALDIFKQLVDRLERYKKENGIDVLDI